MFCFFYVVISMFRCFDMSMFRCFDVLNLNSDQGGACSRAAAGVELHGIDAMRQ